MASARTGAACFSEARRGLRACGEPSRRADEVERDATFVLAIPPEWLRARLFGRHWCSDVPRTSYAPMFPMFAVTRCHADWLRAGKSRESHTRNARRRARICETRS